MKDWDWARSWSVDAGAASASTLPGGSGGICEELTLRVRSRVVLRRVESCCRCSSNRACALPPRFCKACAVDRWQPGVSLLFCSP